MNIIWNGPLLDPSGYGYCSREYILALLNNKHIVLMDPVQYFVGDPRMYIDEKVFNLIGNRLISPDTIMKDWIHVEHKTPGELTNKRCKLSVGYTVWETNRIPDSFASAVNNKDVVWTASEFSKQALLNSGVTTPIKIIPHIINTDKFSPYEDIDRRTLIFLFNGEFTYRKGVDILVKAFMYAFQNNEEVLLLLKTYILDNFSQHSNYINLKISEWCKELNIVNCPKIKVIDSFIKDDELHRIYDVSNVFVSATRGEGFGLPIAEAMSSKLLTIVPSLGGHRDFCNPDNCFLIDSKEVDIPEDKLEIGRKIYKGQKWIEPDLDHLVYLLRGAYQTYKKQDDKKDAGRKAIIEHCNPEKVIKLMEESVNA